MASEYIVFSHTWATVLAVLLFERNSKKVASHIYNASKNLQIDFAHKGLDVCY